ncbi:hypothetical protein EIN_309590 [Entamoeba invadens IP1]|uniref:EF-hand domain-containing protein n=1 Tax=Entamoeba invadens IP1 TaxID=370355 RepID=A0A0A1TWE1_ENTIV|nr:hypothetical protein EIN_309590 [Entamoeba invadens IP1]ELP84956.1 hypothetical protein EIN_309590 [Entamoeba invadens IP1]|eukprot:XP_004184302.1 hypothetical protein EIN_309590 [Entamoeba invadens IP1]
MARERFIIEFCNATTMVKKNTLPVSRCVNMTIANFPSLTARSEEYLTILWKITTKGDDVPKDVYVRTMQYLDNLYFKTGELNGQVIFTAAFFTLDSDGQYSLNTKETSEYFKRLGDKKSIKMVSSYIKEHDENGDGVLQLNEFLDAMNASYNISTIPTAQFLQMIAFTNYYERFLLVPQSKGKVLQEDMVDYLLKNCEDRSVVHKQFVVFILLMCKDKKYISRAEYVALSQQLNFITTKIGKLTNEVLMTCSFRVLDKTLSASIDKGELAKFLKVSGMESKKSVVLKYIEELDENGDGVLQIDEMLSILKVFVKNHVFNTEKYLNNLNARTSKELVDCKSDQKIKVPSHLLNVSTSQTLTKIPENCISLDLYISSFKSSFEKQYLDIEKFVTFLFTVADKKNEGYIFKDQFNMIFQVVQDNNGVVKRDEDLFKLCFELTEYPSKKGIDVNGLMTLCAKLDSPFESEEDALKTLVMYDDNRNGCIEVDEFMLMMFEDDDPKLDDSEEVTKHKNTRMAIKLFRSHDLDRDGYLNEKEVLNVFVVIWDTLSSTDQKAIKIAFLLYGDGDRIDENGFIQMCLMFLYSMEDNEASNIKFLYVLKNVFYMFAKNGNNVMDKNELKTLLEKFKLPATPYDIQNVMTKYGIANMLPIEQFSVVFPQLLGY